MSDGDPLATENPLAAQGGYADLDVPKTGQAFGAMFGADSSSGMLGRFFQRQGQIEQPEAINDLTGEIIPAQPAPTPTVSADYINQNLAPVGPDGQRVKIADKPMPLGLAQLIAKAKGDEIDREGILSRYSEAHSTWTTLPMGAAAFLMDPLNLASAFVPGIGEEAALAGFGRVGAEGLAAKTGARVVSGATGGVAGQLPVTALKYELGQQEASDYDARAALRDLSFAAAGGAVLHAGFGALGDAIKSKAAPVELPQAAAAETPKISPEAADVLTADAHTTHTAINSSVAQLADGREVDVQPFFYRPPEADTAVGQVLHGPEPGFDLTGIAPTVEEQARKIAPDLFAQHDPLAEKIEGLRQQIADPEKAFGTAIDDQATALEQAAVVEQSSRAAKKLTDEVISIRNGRDAAVEAAVNEARQQIVNLDQQMRDLAPQISSARQEAENMVQFAAAQNATVLGPRRVNDPIELARSQRLIQHQGYAAGLTSSDLDRAGTELLGEGAEPEVPTQPGAPEAAAPVLPEGAKAQPEEKPSAGDQEKPADPEMEEAERALADSRAQLLPEERAELDSTQKDVAAAQGRAAGYQQAAACLARSGA